MSEIYEAATEIREELGEIRQILREFQNPKSPQKPLFVGEWACPFCNHKNRNSFDPFSINLMKPSIFWCDTKSGGCEAMVAV
jgi:hypothetical protein